MSDHPDLPGALRALADLFDIRGAAIEAADLRRGALALEGFGRDRIGHVARLARRDRLDDIRTLSPLVHARVREIVRQGPASALERVFQALPAFLRHALDGNVVTPSDAARLVKALGIATTTDVKVAAEAGWLSRRAGGPAAAALMDALAEFRPQLTTLGRAWDVLEDLANDIRSHSPEIHSIEPAGDVRRVEPIVAELVLVASAENPQSALDAVVSAGSAVDVLCRAHGAAGATEGPTACARVIAMYQQVEVDIRVARPEHYGTVLFEATGSVGHVVAVAARRRTRVPVAREEMLYADAGLPCIPSELRGTPAVVSGALANEVPPLVEVRHIRGDLHVHSNYSDGRDSVDRMVGACREIGYAYVAITDHSENAGASRTLRAGDIPRQRDEIARVRELYPDIAILHGVEVDILPDGRLDFPDEVLEQLDVVLASLHDAAGQNGDRLTARCLEALRHPLVNVLTHPGNQLVGRRPGYPLDYPRLFAAAAETGTALEVDGAPGHLDLSGEQARAAAAAGAILTIDSDSHRAVSLERQMRLGVGTARRGGIEPRQVLNTRSVEEIRLFVARKRTGGA